MTTALRSTAATSVVDPYAGEVVAHTQPTGSGCIASHTHKYGSAKLRIKLADGRI
ncbi:hypothetical protein [Streptomyces sp. NPDC057557]|uniref:hypothetical protein n=1 Tax=Streptomyces sp. NPDC057557 TaxID=3346167 RepID=UPI00368A0935